MARATDAGVLGALERLLGWAAGAALFAMMALTFADVVGRKLFDASITGSLELTELLMMVMIFAALPLASLAGTHVLFDLLDRLVPAGWARAQHALAHGLCVLLLTGAAWLTFARAARTLAQGDQTAQLGLGVAPFQYAAAVLIALTALMHAVLAWRGTPRSAAEDTATPPPAGAL